MESAAPREVSPRAPVPGRRNRGLAFRQFLVSGRLSGFLIKALAVYSSIVLTIVGTLVLVGSRDPAARAVIAMALGTVALWVVLGGTLMWRFRDRIGSMIRRVPLGWRTKFVLGCTTLALLEEVVTTSMTNMAPLLGVTPEQAHITASTNYLHVVLFHSVIVFIPWFIVWQSLLARYDFNPRQVFLLVGLLGSTAEAWLNPTSLVAGFWFFIYGLMVYIPAYSIPPPGVRGATRPRRRHYALALLLPMVASIPVAVVVVAVRQTLGIPLFPGT